MKTEADHLADSIIKRHNDNAYSYEQDTLLVKRLTLVLKDRLLVAKVLQVIDVTCMRCFNRSKPCRCWDDE